MRMLLALLLLAPSSVPQAQERSLLAPSARGLAAPQGLAALAREARPVELDLALLRSGEDVRIELFGGRAFVARHRSTEAGYGGARLWRAEIDGDEGDVLLARTGDAVVGSIQFEGELYRIAPGSGGKLWLSHGEPSSLPLCGTQSSSQVLGDSGSRPTAPATRLPVIDVLVAYTPEAKTAAGGTSAMNSLINLAVTETNDAYAASGVAQTLRLVHTAEMVGYVEPPGFSTILSQLTSKNDGYMDEVHTLRDQYGADAVSLICKNGAYCGQAHLMTVVSPAFESKAFSVTNYGCATGYYSFGHELGHNFGSHHDPANAGGAAYPYSYGYRTPDDRYRTVMAYAPGTRVKRFSSPTATWAGYTLGNASQDNARSMNNTAATVAAWRSACGPAAVAKRTMGGNLDVFTATPPVIGQGVTFTIDTQGFPFATVFGVSAPAARLLDSGDWVLIDIDSPILFNSGPLLGPVAQTSAVLSNDPSTCGVTIYTQAKLHGVAPRPFRLTNSQDLQLGN